MDGMDLFFRRAIERLLESMRDDREYDRSILDNLSKDERALWSEISNALALSKKETKNESSKS